MFVLVLSKDHCIPDTFDKVRKAIRDIGLGNEKIHIGASDIYMPGKIVVSESLITL